MPSLTTAIFLMGFAQLAVLVASALVPLQLNWKAQLATLPPLVRQLFWVYGGYIVLSIVCLGTICLTQAPEIAAGSGLARAYCSYGAAFWGIRLLLQTILDVKPHLTAPWLHAGYHLLTVLFLTFTATFLWGVFH